MDDNNKIENLKCAICYQNYGLSDGELLNCDHNIHKQCLISLIINQCKDGNYNFTCPIDKCGKTLSHEILDIFVPNRTIKIKDEIKIQDNYCTQQENEILNAFGYENIGVCPSCDIPYTKDHGCNHATCLQCKKDFCFICSVDRVPICAHGNHYHREGCSDYQPWIDERTKLEILTEEFHTKKCSKCRDTQKPCPRPMPLDQFKKQNKWFQSKKQ